MFLSVHEVTVFVIMGGRVEVRTCARHDNFSEVAMSTSPLWTSYLVSATVSLMTLVYHLGFLPHSKPCGRETF